jgi:hypothetical protein
MADRSLTSPKVDEFSIQDSILRVPLSTSRDGAEKVHAIQNIIK